MRATEDLYRLADQEGIEIRFARLNPYWDGLYLRDPNLPPYILLDHGVDKHQVQFRAVLAEELGHHFTTEGPWVRVASSSSNARVMHDKVELRAIRWAIDYMIDGHELLWAWRRYQNVWDLVDRFGVPGPWIVDKLAWMKGMSMSSVS